MTEKIECPVCESEIPSESEKCPECGVDLSLFDIDISETSIESEKDIKEIMGKLLDDEEDLDFIEELEDIDEEDIQDTEGLEDVKDALEEEDTEEEVVMFACPICDAEVSEDASECPQCGAIFEEDDEEEEVEEELAEEDIEQMITDARKALSEARNTKIDIGDIKGLMKQAIGKKNKGDFGEALEIFKDVVKWSEKVTGLYEDIIDAKKGIKKLKKEGIDYKQHLIELKEIKTKADKGNYTNAEDSIHDLANRINSDLDKESKKKDETEKEELKNEFKSRISLLKEKVAEAKDTKVGAKPLKTIISEVKEAGTAGEFDKALKKIDEASVIFDKIIESHEMIVPIEEEIQKLEESGADVDRFQDDLDKALESADEGDYEKAFKLFEGISSDLTEFQKEKVVEEYKKELADARRKLSKARNFKLNIDYLKKLMRKAVNAGKEENYEKGLSFTAEIQDRYGCLEEVSKKLKKSKRLVRDLRENDISYNQYVKELKKAKRLSNEGEYDDSLSIIEDIIDDMELELDMIKEDEELPSAEEIETEVEEELKKAGKEIEIPEEEEPKEEVPSAEEIEAEIEAELKKTEKEVKVREDEEVEEELYMEDIEKLTRNLKSLIQTAKQNGFSLESGKETIDKAIESTKREDYKTAHDLLIEGKEKVTDEIKNIVEEKIMDIELAVEETGYENDLESDISKVREKMEENSHGEAMLLLKTIEENVVSVSGPAEESNEKLDKVQEVIDEADYVGIDIKEAKELLDKAKQESKVGNYMDAEDLAEEAKDAVLTSVPEFMKDRVSKAKGEIMKAKIVGTDVSRSVDLLKQANRARKNEDFEDCLHYIKRFEEDMKEKAG